MLPLLTSAVLLTAGSAVAAPASAQNTTVVSLHPSDLSAAPGWLESISGDGRFIFFITRDALLPNDLNGSNDLYVLDRPSESYELISLDVNALAAGNVNAYGISRDGRYVVFDSSTDNVVAGDVNGLTDVFHLDRATGRMTLVSRGLGGAPSDGSSRDPTVTNDGQFIAFISSARNLVVRDTTRFDDDVYVHHLASRTTGIVSKNPAGEQGNDDSYDPVITGDGSAVMFVSEATNFAPGDGGRNRDVFVRDLRTGALRCVTTDRFGMVDTVSVNSASIREDGSEVAFSAYDSDFVLVDDNQASDIFVMNVQSGVAELVSLDRFGGLADGWSSSPSISSDGSKVVFSSEATDLVSSDANGATDVFVLNRLTGITERVSLDSGGQEIEFSSGIHWSGQRISDDGRFVAFYGHPQLATMSPSDNFSAILLRDREGLGLIREGTFPGVITMRVVGAEPGATLALLYGQHGPSIAGSGPCAGLKLHLLAPTNVQTLTADSMGQAVTTLNQNHTYSEAWVQVVSAASCRPSNEVFVDERELTLRQDSFGNWCTSNAAVRVTTTGALPNSNVSLFYGVPGATTWPGRICTGLVLGVTSPVWLATLPANAAGEVEFVFDMPNAQCSMSLQAISHDDCLLSNLIVLR